MARNIARMLSTQQMAQVSVIAAHTWHALLGLLLGRACHALPRLRRAPASPTYTSKRVPLSPTYLTAPSAHYSH